jgi:hypothetical protein
MRVGTGLLEFQPLAPGDPVALQKGATQGWFVPLSLRARGIDPDDAAVCYRGTLLPTAEEIGVQCWNVQFVTPLENGWHERLGLMAQLHPDYWDAPEELLGQEVRLEVFLADDSPCSVASAITVRLAGP